MRLASRQPRRRWQKQYDRYLYTKMNVNIRNCASLHPASSARSPPGSPLPVSWTFSSLDCRQIERVHFPAWPLITQRSLTKLADEVKTLILELGGGSLIRAVIDPLKIAQKPPFNRVSQRLPFFPRSAAKHECVQRKVAYVVRAAYNPVPIASTSWAACGIGGGNTKRGRAGQAEVGYPSYCSAF